MRLVVQREAPQPRVGYKLWQWLHSPNIHKVPHFCWWRNWKQKYLYQIRANPNPRLFIMV